MSSLRLIDVVGRLGSFDETHTIYATEPWGPDAPAIVAQPPEDPRGIPVEAEQQRATYFLEVWLAKQLVEDWINDSGRPIEITDQCNRLIEYAVDDA